MRVNQRESTNVLEGGGAVWQWNNGTDSSRVTIEGTASVARLSGGGFNESYLSDSGHTMRESLISSGRGNPLRSIQNEFDDDNEKDSKIVGEGTDISSARDRRSCVSRDDSIVSI